MKKKYPWGGKQLFKLRRDYGEECHTCVASNHVCMDCSVYYRSTAYKWQIGVATVALIIFALSVIVVVLKQKGVL